MPAGAGGRGVLIRPGTADQGVYGEVFGQQEYSLDLRDPRLIIDAGAHIGLASVYFATRYPNATVVALEPEQSNFDLLAKNAAAYPNIVPLNVGLWSHSTRLRLVDPGVPTWSFRFEETSDPKGYPAVGVADLIARYANGGDIDLLKIDIEGSEIEALASSSEWISRVRAVAIELHDRFRPGCSDALAQAVKGEDFVSSVSGENVVLTRTRR